MPRKILVAVAWPYVNGEPHLGHIAGMNVPADIFARYHRIVGNEVVMVSGSDMHGTPTALKAADEGVSPEVVAERYHEIWRTSLATMDFSFDLYTHTHTEAPWYKIPAMHGREFQNSPPCFEVYQNSPP